MRFEGVPAWVHPAAVCKGERCPFHAPSTHVMRGWPMNLRETGLIERLCDHGVGHPDPDSAAWMDRRFGHRPGTWSSHGCDGCCAESADLLERSHDLPRRSGPRHAQDGEGL